MACNVVRDDPALTGVSQAAFCKMLDGTGVDIPADAEQAYQEYLASQPAKPGGRKADACLKARGGGHRLP